MFVIVSHGAFMLSVKICDISSWRFDDECVNMSHGALMLSV